jgi:hypothetical protein
VLPWLIDTKKKSLVEHTFEFKTKISSLDNGDDLETQRKNKAWSNAKTC